jgi:sigma-54 interacting transcriptional regulator
MSTMKRRHRVATNGLQPSRARYKGISSYLIGDRDLHSALQGKLLHVLEDGQFSQVGGRSNIKVDVRVVAATNQDLEQAVAAKQFREELFYRLHVVRVTVPPLRFSTAPEIRASCSGGADLAGITHKVIHRYLPRLATTKAVKSRRRPSQGLSALAAAAPPMLSSHSFNANLSFPLEARTANLGWPEFRGQWRATKNTRVERMRKQALGRRHGALSLRPTARPTSASESGRKRSRSWGATSSSATQDFFNERSRCHPETIERLTWRDFLANVRELESTIKRMIVLGDPRLGAPAGQTANGDHEAASDFL